MDSFFNYPLPELQNLFIRSGKEKFRSQQMYKWVYEKKVTDLERMSNLSKDFRAELQNIFDFTLPKIKVHLKSVDGTQKFLFELADGLTIESVVIPSEDRLTLCVSSEVGCNMACKFCYTGKQKLKRRLTAAEIVGQFYQVEENLGEGLKLSNIVFMGMGEPLDNCEAVFSAIEILHSPYGRNFSKRKVTVSTSGLVPEMYRIREAGVRLAVSLNGYDDESRSLTMPINKKYPLKELLAECMNYVRDRKDRVTFEYVLLKGITDEPEHAKKLAQLVRHVPCKINLIPFNEHPGSDFVRPSDERVMRFHTELYQQGVHVLLRRTMGRDIYAACGQLNTVAKNQVASN